MRTRITPTKAKPAKATKPTKAAAKPTKAAKPAKTAEKPAENSPKPKVSAKDRNVKAVTPFGERVLKAIQTSGMSVTAWAVTHGVSSSTVYAWIRGIRVPDALAAPTVDAILKKYE